MNSYLAGLLKNANKIDLHSYLPGCPSPTDSDVNKNVLRPLSTLSTPLRITNSLSLSFIFEEVMQPRQWTNGKETLYIGCSPDNSQYYLFAAGNTSNLFTFYFSSISTKINILNFFLYL